MSDHEAPTGAPIPPTPHPTLRELDILEGEWRLEGRDSSGQPFTGSVTRRWLDGGFFLTQETRMDGQPHDGIEYIGYDSATGMLRSMLFSAEGPGPFCPFALEYFWQVEGDNLTIWHGEKGSPALFTGTIDRNAATVQGAWEWPGGGYQVDATRVPNREDQ
ncbi:conserved hypothetical protein [Nostocoides australiense Ben110]|uniref:DUF1579 domain-containing protein n=1 Tax=Nostocoides australiense Ben110 TaxID=1193182 RepID=W6K1Q4_9MICO|nr:DUF1579 family protein [Tetrasphaera australiensis]CCH74930.1 conserved hypothetical protein [Tetrasphaera australiensis Ben110]